MKVSKCIIIKIYNRGCTVNPSPFRDHPKCVKDINPQL